MHPHVNTSFLRYTDTFFSLFSHSPLPSPLISHPSSFIQHPSPLTLTLYPSHLASYTLHLTLISSPLTPHPSPLTPHTFLSSHLPSPSFPRPLRPPSLPSYPIPLDPILTSLSIPLTLHVPFSALALLPPSTTISPTLSLVPFSPILAYNHSLVS